MEDEVKASEYETEVTGATPHTGRRAAFEAIERLDAEVAAHEPPTFPNHDFWADGEQHGAAVGEPLGHETKLEPGREWDYGAGLPPIAPFGRITPDPSMDLSSDACSVRHAAYGWCYKTGTHDRHESALGSWEAESPGPAPEPDPADEKEPRPGERLREWVVREMPPAKAAASLGALSHRIDNDISELARENVLVAAKLRLLRRQVVGAVERLRYAVAAETWERVGGETPHFRQGEPGRKDVLDAEPLMAELDRIFGERRADEGAEIIRAALGWCVTQGADEQADILREACLVYLKSQPAASYEDRRRHDKEEVGGAIYEAALAANQTTREICQRCHAVSAVGFHAPTETWRAVAGRDWANSILCIRCFAALGDEKFIAWERGLVFYPVSYASHHTERSGRSAP